MPLCVKTKEMAKDAGIKEDVIQWLENAGFASYRDVALMSTEEKDVKADIVEPMRSSEPAVAYPTCVPAVGLVCLNTWARVGPMVRSYGLVSSVSGFSFPPLLAKASTPDE